MKLLFALGLTLVLVGGAATRWSYPDNGGGPTVLYWVTDPSPSRDAHAAGFLSWQVDHGHVDADGEPLARVVIDGNNGAVDKIVIQGVAGVASDLIDTRWGSQLRLFSGVGITRDVTEEALARGFSPADTWPAAGPEITAGGRQFMYPCNVAVRMLWVNREPFRRLGLPVPEGPWTLEEFEARGLEFKRRAAEETPGVPVFFADELPLEILHRSVGLSSLNETLTASHLDDPRYAEILRLKHKWTYEQGLLPTPDDRAAVAAEGSWGGMSSQLFRENRLGMVYSGRYQLIQFREFVRQGTAEPLDLTVAEPPHGGFRNTRTTVRGAGVYAGRAEPGAGAPVRGVPRQRAVQPDDHRRRGPRCRRTRTSSTRRPSAGRRAGPTSGAPTSGSWRRSGRPPSPGSTASSC